MKTYTEYVIWGIPEGSTEEAVLLTCAPSGRPITDKQTAWCFADVLTQKHGAKKVRVQELDLTTSPNFAACVNV